MGIEFKLNEVAATCSWTISLKDYDAVPGRGYLSVHAWRTRERRRSARRVRRAPLFLIANKQIMGHGETADEPYVSMEGKRVVVLGGGDTAMDWMRVPSIRQNARRT